MFPDKVNNNQIVKIYKFERTGNGYVIFDNGAIYWLPQSFTVQVIRKTQIGKFILNGDNNCLFSFMNEKEFHKQRLKYNRSKWFIKCPGGTSLLHRFKNVNTFIKRFSASTLLNEGSVFNQSELSEINAVYDEIFKTKVDIK